MKVVARLLLAIVLALGVTGGVTPVARAETTDPIWVWGDSLDCTNGHPVTECAYKTVARLVGFTGPDGCVVSEEQFCRDIVYNEKTWLWKPITQWDLAQAVLLGYGQVTQNPDVLRGTFSTQFSQSLYAAAQARVASLFDPTTHEYLGPKPVLPAATPKLSDTTPAVGQTITALEGTWGAADVQFTYQWFQGSSQIDGATERTFTARPADLGKTLKVKVTGTAAGFDPASKTSTASYTVSKGKLASTTPTVDDTTPTVDQTLTATPGAWGPDGVQLAYQWYGVSSSGRTYTIKGATGSTYTVSGSYAGYRLKVKVTGSLAGYSTASRTSARTSKVAKAVFTATVKPTIAVEGTPRAGKMMTVQPGIWQPGATFSYRWYRGTTAISGATKASYTPTSSDLAKQLKVRVTGSRTGYVTVTSYTDPTAAVQAGLTGVATPKLSDTTPKVDQQLTVANTVCPATAGSGATVAASYQWYEGSTAITDATAGTFTVRPVDVGRTIKVKVTCIADDYAPVAKTSSSSYTITRATFTAKGVASIDGTLKLGETVTANEGSWTPTPDSYTYQWYRNGTAQTGETTKTLAVNALGDYTVKITAIRAGYTTASSTSAAARVRQHATQVAVGERHSCVVTTEATVACWGENNWGQLGDGTTTNRRAPVMVSGLSGVTALAVSTNVAGRRTCALTTSGSVKCWGANEYGQIDGGTADRLTPVELAGLSGVTAMSAGEEHMCAVVGSGTVQCWGSNYEGQLGDGTYTYRKDPTSVPGLSGVTAIATGRWHTCAVAAGGTVHCWGDNEAGQLGVPVDEPYVPVPVQVPGLRDVTAITAGSFWTCALKSNGTVLCWGANEEGNLGDGTKVDRSTPEVVPGLAGVTEISAGGWFDGFHTCAVTASGQAWCWGGGTGYGSQQTTPTLVSGLSGVTEIATTGDHTCVVAEGGGVKCWGRNFYGGLGDGTTTDRSRPVTVIGFG